MAKGLSSLLTQKLNETGLQFLGSPSSFQDSVPDSIPETEDTSSNQKDYPKISINMADMRKDAMYFIDGAEEKLFTGYISGQNCAYPVFIGDVSVCCGQLYNRSFSAFSHYHELVLSVPDIDNDNYKKAIKKACKSFNIVPLFYYYCEGTNLYSRAKNNIHYRMRRCEEEMLRHLCSKAEKTESFPDIIIDGHFPWRDEQNIKRESELTDLKKHCEDLNVISIDKSFSFDSLPSETRNGIAELHNNNVDRPFIPKQNEGLVRWYLRLRIDSRATEVRSDILECAIVYNQEDYQGRVEEWCSKLHNLKWPTCYGLDKSRWRTHIYPIYLTELYSKQHQKSIQILKQMIYG